MPDVFSVRRTDDRSFPQNHKFPAWSSWILQKLPAPTFHELPVPPFCGNFQSAHKKVQKSAQMPPDQIPASVADTG